MHFSTSRSSPTSRYNIIILDHCAQSTPSTRSQHHVQRLRAYSATRKSISNITIPRHPLGYQHPSRPGTLLADRNLVRITRHICPSEWHVFVCLLRTQTNDLRRKATGSRLCRAINHPPSAS